MNTEELEKQVEMKKQALEIANERSRDGLNLAQLNFYLLVDIRERLKSEKRG